MAAEKGWPTYGQRTAGKNASAQNNGQATDSGDDATPVLADKLLTRSDLRNLPDPAPLIDNVLDLGTTALLYGKWSTAKTFIALDWAASVATGRRWFDRETVQRKVLYIVGEGAFGFKGRVDAWEMGWRKEISDEWLNILPVPVNMLKPLEVANLKALIEWNGYGFVVLDTVARCMVGGDENSAKDGGIFMDAMTQLLAATPDGRGVVLAVHHAGKDGQTLRGSSAFEGASDTVYFSSRDEDNGWISLTREKRKDGPEHDHHLFKVDPMPGTTSAVLRAGRAEDIAPPDAKETFTIVELADIMHRVITDQPDHSVASRNKIYAAMRLKGQTFRTASMAQAVDVLVLSGRLAEVPGKRNAMGYRAISSVSQQGSDK